MFLSVKFNRKIAIAIVLIAVIVIAAIVVFASRADGAKESISVRDNEGRVKYLQSIGWAVEPEPVEAKSIVLPREFDEIYSKYNEIQIEQGFNLMDYAGLEVWFYGYKVTNYPGSNDVVIANLIIHNNKVIGGDIHSTALDGFIHGLK